MTREDIYAAFFAQLQSITAAPYLLAIPTISRQFLHWDNCPNQPAIFLAPEEEIAKYERGKPYIIWTIRCAVWVYAKAGDQNTPGIVVVSQVLDALEQIIMPRPPN